MFRVGSTLILSHILHIMLYVHDIAHHMAQIYRKV